MKKQNINISKRLKTIADMAITESTIVDVGVDSGNLDIFIAQNSNRIKTIFAIEEKKKPFENLKHNIEYFCVSNIVQPILLNHIPDEKFDCVIIAGLGCYSIWEILEKYGLEKLENKKLILGPQGSHMEIFVLKKRLSEYFEISSSLIKEAGKFYEILELKKGKKISSNIDLMFNVQSENLSDIEEYCLLKKKELEIYFKYFDKKKIKRDSFIELKNKKLFEEFRNYEN